MAYLNLVRLDDETYNPGEGEQADRGENGGANRLLPSPMTTIAAEDDPLDASSLLPWKLNSISTAGTTLTSTTNTDVNAHQQGNDRRAAGGRTTSGDDGRGGSDSTGGDSDGDDSLREKLDPGKWKEAASTRFMELWGDFLEHKDAPHDEQYGIIKDIYTRIVDNIAKSKGRSTSKK